jgi:ribosome-associated heat shock protein Hsp15
MRIDKFLWCIRLFKTRSLATEACQKGRVKLNDREAKPSAEVRLGDRFAVRQPPIWRVFAVQSLPASRVGAKLVPQHITEVTPWEDLEKQELARKVRVASRDPGEGRPTKRERRDMDRFEGRE